MKALAGLFVLSGALLFSSPGSLALTETDLSAVSLTPVIGAAVPADIPFVDENGRSISFGDVAGGRATLLILADYNCRTLCGPILAMAAASVVNSGLVAGRDFDLVVVGINPEESRADAIRTRSAEFGDDHRLAAGHFLEGDAESIRRLSSALGYHAQYDAVSRQYAHPTDMLVLTADRRISRLLPGLVVDGEDLRFALVEAGNGLFASLIDRAHVLCYGLDAAHGIYDAPIHTALVGTAGATLASVLCLMAAARRRRRKTQGT